MIIILEQKLLLIKKLLRGVNFLPVSTLACQQQT